jgi:hypothetical protein
VKNRELSNWTKQKFLIYGQMGITIKSDGRTSGCTANLRDIEGNQ